MVVAHSLQGLTNYKLKTINLKLVMENIQAKRKFPYIKGLFSYRWILNNLVFFLFVAFLAVLYIANGHEADKIIRDINITAKEIKELKYEYKTLKSEEISKSRQAQVADAASALGLRLSAQPPVHVTLEDTHTQK